MNIDDAIHALTAGASAVESALYLDLNGCIVRVQSNSVELIEQLSGYFAHVKTDATAHQIAVLAIERGAPDLGIDFVDWKREAGKQGRKDSYHDLPGARLVRKVRTGMVFLQSERAAIAAGPCRRYDNQVINFINAQYMNWLQQRGWLICHAAALVRDHRALGIAGFSGGGKSTLMLNMLEAPATRYLTNDRLFIRRQQADVQAVGIPKLPRVNPGTIVNNPRLHPLIPQAQRNRLMQMPPAELWEMEEKYDVMIGQTYGADRIAGQASLGAFLILNWQREDHQLTAVERVDLDRRRDLLAAIMKSPGPFYQYADGRFFQDSTPFDEISYLEVLADVPIYEAHGGVDFQAVEKQLGTMLGEKS
jgi:HprK-related kinase B